MTREEAAIQLDAAIAAAHAAYEKKLAQIARNEKSPRSLATKSARQERNRRIVDMRDLGMRFKEIGAAVGLSHYQTRAIFWHVNFLRTNYPDEYDKYGEQ